MLTVKEFDLLEYLMSNPRQVFTRNQILEQVWGYDFVGDSNVIEVYVRYLRIKLEENQVWQNRLNPVQKVIGDGCHLNRNIRQIIEQQFSEVSLEEFYLENEPNFLGYTYKGIATKKI